MRHVLLTSLVLASYPACAQERTIYTYDAQGRLVRTEVTGTGDGVTTAYRLDPADNRANVAVIEVADASFETPEVGSGFQYAPTVPGAVFWNGAGVTGNASAWGFLPTPDGDQVAFVQSANGETSHIDLSVSGLGAGLSYKVSFYLASRPGYGVNPVIVSIDGTSLGTFTPASSAFERVITANFVASGTGGTLRFAGSPVLPDSASAIDKVVVMPAASP